MKTRRIILAGMLLLIIMFTGFTSLTTKSLAAERMMGLGATEPVTILDAEVSLFHSEKTNQDYRIYVALPQGYDANPPSPAKYPVVYMLDANWHFGIVAGMTRQLYLAGELGQVIVVGIGYPTDDNNELVNLRAWDMLPGLGADMFLEFIQDELIPEIDSSYRTTKGDERTLAGHSFGGLFTLYALFHAPETFENYLAMSPALWWDWEGDGIRDAFAFEEAFAVEHHKLPVELFLSVGEYEPEAQWNLWMVSNLIEFHQTLEDRNYAGLKMDMVIMEGVNHAASYPGAVTRGLVEISP